MAAETTESPTRSRGTAPVTSNENFDYDRTNLDNCEPELCIRILNLPNVTNLAGIGTRLKTSNDEWMLEFLKMDGLLLLTEYLAKLGKNQSADCVNDGTSFECIGCIKAILNRKIGLNFLLQKKNQNLVQNILLGLNSVNVKTNMAIIEILSVISLYSAEGYHSVIAALQFYKTEKQRRHKFSIIIGELERSKSLQFKSTLLAFVNCLICRNTNVTERWQIRQEFIDLGLLEILDQLSNEDDDYLITQLEVFDQFKMNDEETLPDDLDSDIKMAADVNQENKNSQSERKYRSVVKEKRKMKSRSDLCMDEVDGAFAGLPSSVEVDSDDIEPCQCLIDDIWKKISTGSDWLQK